MIRNLGHLTCLQNLLLQVVCHRGESCDLSLQIGDKVFGNLTALALLDLGFGWLHYNLWWLSFTLELHLLFGFIALGIDLVDDLSEFLYANLT